MNYKPWPKKERIYYSDLVYAVTGEKGFTRKLKKLTPLVYQLAIGNEGMRIAMKSLKKAGLLGGKK